MEDVVIFNIEFKGAGDGRGGEGGGRRGGGVGGERGGMQW